MLIPRVVPLVEKVDPRPVPLRVVVDGLLLVVERLRIVQILRLIGLLLPAWWSLPLFKQQMLRHWIP